MDFVTEEDMAQSKRERSTLLVRRFWRDNREVKKSVCTGTKAIVRKLPSGGIGEDAWGAICKGVPQPWNDHSRSSCGYEIYGKHTGYILVLKSDTLEVCQHLLQTGRKLLEVCHALNGELLVANLQYLYQSSSLLISTVKRGAVLPWLGPRVRATTQRTTISTFISGPLLEGVLFLSDSGSSFGVSTSSSNWAALKEHQPNSPMAGSSVAPLAEVSKELALLQHLLPFPEEIAYVLMEKELQFYRSILPLDYLLFLTQNLSRTSSLPNYSQTNGSHSQYLTSSPFSSLSMAVSHDSQQFKTVKDLVLRFNEVSCY